MKKTYYKIVKVVDDKFYSYNVQPGLQYRVGYWTRPKVGKLFVFDNLYVARSFYTACVHKIFECEVDSPTRFKYRCDTSIPLSEEDIKNFWDNYFKVN